MSRTAKKRAARAPKPQPQPQARAAALPGAPTPPAASQPDRATRRRRAASNAPPPADSGTPAPGRSSARHATATAPSSKPTGTTGATRVTSRNAGASDTARAGSKHPWWPLAKRVLIVLFFSAVAWLIYRNAKEVDWREVFAVLRDYPNTILLLAAAVAASSHALYSTFDLLGRHWTGHSLAVRQVVPVTFVSYAFNLNLGSLVGGIAFRYRLYSRLGLDTDTTSRVLGLSLVTNWLGYLVLAGGVFALRIISPPDDWKLGATALQVLGFALLATAAAYLVLCAVRAGHEYSVRGHRLVVPSLRMALLQLGLSMTNWAVIAAVIYVLLQFKLPYPLVLGVLLIAAVAGVVAHIPAGLGVLEAVFIALLGHRMPQGELLAALIAYRAIYYLAPMAAATALYLSLEARARKGGSQASAARARA